MYRRTSDYKITAKRELHGMVGTPEYQSWYSAKTRVMNTNRRDAKWYGGLDMCPEWLQSFTAFYRDMGSRPPNTCLDRIDNTRGYYPDNCRWVDMNVQANNRRKRIAYPPRDNKGKFIKEKV